MCADIAVCYVADVNFLFGTLVSLRSLRQFVPASAAEAYVFYLNSDPQLMARAQTVLSKLAATMLPLNIADHIDLAGKSWNKTHVPQSALGRFYIEPELPSHIQRILYIDGDTLFVGDPTDLIHYVPPGEGLAAAEDISFFARNDWGKFGAQTRAYFAGLGIDGSRGYLNSGLLLANRSAWKTITTEAIQFFDQHSDRCRYHDQSALNAVVGARRVRLSPKWNFQTPFCYWSLREGAQPRILHFTEFPKPWMGEVAPWGFVKDAFKDAMREFSDLGLPLRTLSTLEVEKYNKLKLNRARKLAWQMPLRLLLRRRDFWRLVQHATI